jgi:hypothetical protein
VAAVAAAAADTLGVLLGACTRAHMCVFGSCWCGLQDT